MTEPRTPSTPQSLAQLRQAVLDEHYRLDLDSNPGDDSHICACGAPWPCDAVRLAILLSVENVAAAIFNIGDRVGYSRERYAAALLEAIGASHD